MKSTNRLGTLILAACLSFSMITAAAPTSFAASGFFKKLFNPSSSTVAAEEVVTPEVVTTTPNGERYAWNPQGLFVTADSDRVLLDYFTYILQHKLEMKNEVIFIALDDLQRIYAPDFKVERNGSKLTLTHAGVSTEIKIGSTSATFYTGSGTLEVAPYENNGVVFVPFFDLMVKGFGKTLSSNGIYYGLGNSESFEVTRSDVYNLKMFFRGKDVGKSYWVFWNDEVQRLMPVVMYIPSTYDISTPNKLIVQLHGAGGNATSLPDSDRGTLMMQYAENYGYIVMWPDSYASMCNFGMWVQPVGQLPITDKNDPSNPGGYSPEKLADIKLSGNNVQRSIDFVESKWNIHPDNIFIMGISMGGCGTWYQAATYGERFAAASPSGAFVEPAYFDWSQIKIPTMYVGGTEDRNGFDLMLNAYKIAMGQGANIVEFVTVGGAEHGAEWPLVLEKTYEFFDSYVTK